MKTLLAKINAPYVTTRRTDLEMFAVGFACGAGFITVVIDLFVRG